MPDNDFYNLQQAVVSGDQQTVSKLVAEGCDVNGKNDNGLTLAMLAVVAGDLPMLEHLCNLGAELSLTSPGGMNVLMYAASSGDVKILRWLLDKKLDVNAKTRGGISALDFASAKNHKDAVAVLKSAGAIQDNASNLAESAGQLFDAAKKGLGNLIGKFPRSESNGRGTRANQKSDDDDPFKLLFGDPGMDALKNLYTAYQDVPDGSGKQENRNPAQAAKKLLDLVEEEKRSSVKEQSADNDKEPEDEEPEIPKEDLKLEDLVGQEEAKLSLRQIIAVARLNEERKRRGINAINVTFHAVFSGSPGTGKTTFARFYAQEIKKLGILRKGQLIEVSRQDLVAEYQGQTATKTYEVVKKALGGILFIDEAYGLKSSKDDNFGQECIDTLVKAIEDHRKDLIVILAGYTDEMRHFLHLNSGLNSRIPNHVEFADFELSELQDIFSIMSSKQGLKVTDAATELVNDSLAIAKRGKSFGNAREVRNILERCLAQQSVRLGKMDLAALSKEELTTIIRSDVTLDPDDEGDGESRPVTRVSGAMDKLHELEGLEGIKREVGRLADYLRVTKARRGGGEVSDITVHMIFSGNPGTGKTTVARLLGDVFKEIGFLPSGHLVETDRSGLVAEYVGQTAVKTKEKLEDALGGVLFVDEAYALARDQYGRESIDTLLKFMEDQRGKLVVVLAGYTTEMQNFIQTNPGLAGRFSKVLDFEDFTMSQMISIARGMAEDQGFDLASSALTKLEEILEKEQELPGFANARTVRNILERGYKKQAERIVASGDPSAMDKSVLNQLTDEDFTGL